MARTPLNRTPLSRSLPLRAVVPGLRPVPHSGTPSRPHPDTFLDAVVDWGRYVGRRPAAAGRAARGRVRRRRRIGGGVPLARRRRADASDQLDELGETSSGSTRWPSRTPPPHQRPKLERYDDTLFRPLQDPHTTSSTTNPPRTARSWRPESDVLHRPGLLSITVPARRPGLVVGPCGTGSRGDPVALLAKGPAAVLHAVADHVVDGYLRRRRRRAGDDIDEVETEVFSPGQPRGNRRRTDLPAQARGPGVQARGVAPPAPHATAE